MICPNKICRQEIPDDSRYCDQCGALLLQCVKCSNTGVSKFCVKCGGKMEERAAIKSVPEPAIEPAAPASAQPAPPEASPPVTTDAHLKSIAAGGAPTIVVRIPSEKILLCHPDGWNLELSNGDILGRTNGPHAARLGAFPVISGTHAQISLNRGEWFLTDMKSTNKTWVNGVCLEPNVPARIKQNDVVLLANVTFTVREL